MKYKEKYTFTNWGKNIKATASHYLQPETEEELIDLIKKYENIRVVGTGHSWSDICVTDGALINLDHYDKVINIDKKSGIVKTQAGIKLWQLNQILAKHGLALESQGSIDEQSLAGVIATGTHGSGIDFQIIGGQVLELKLLKADGSKLIINKEKDKELYGACVVNLGALGVVSEITLQAVKDFNLHDYSTTVSFDLIIDDLDTFLDINDHLKFWWFPPSKKIGLFSYQRTYKEVNDRRWRRFLKDEVLSVGIYRSLVFAARLQPRFAKRINQFLTWNLKGPVRRIAKCSHVFKVPKPPIHIETEWAFDATKAKEILKEYKALITNNNYNLNFIQEIRFTKSDDFWLSPCYGRDTMWIGLYCFSHEKWNEIFAEFEKFAKKHNGRPHWGKLFRAPKTYLAQTYPHYDKFFTLREEMDPVGKFANDYINRLL